MGIRGSWKVFDVHLQDVCYLLMHHGPGTWSKCQGNVPDKVLFDIDDTKMLSLSEQLESYIVMHTHKSDIRLRKQVDAVSVGATNSETTSLNLALSIIIRKFSVIM